MKTSALAFLICCVPVYAASAEKTELVVQLGHNNLVKTVACSADGRLVASGGLDKSAKLWDAASGRLLRTFAGHGEPLSAVALTADNRFLLTAAISDIKIWESATGMLVRTLRTGLLYSAAISPDGQSVLVGNGSGATLWNVTSGEKIRAFSGHAFAVTSVAFSPDGKRIVTEGSGDGSVRLWDVSSGDALKKMAHTDGLAAVAFSPDGKSIASGGWDHVARSWDLSGQQLRAFTGHAGRISSLAFSPDGSKLLTGGEDKNAILWDAATGKALRTIVVSDGHVMDSTKVNAVCFGADGRWIATASGNGVQLWDAATGRGLRALTSYTAQGGASENGRNIASVAFSPDGHTVALGIEDKTIRLWDLSTGRQARVLAGHAHAVASVAFSPDGRALLSAGLETENARLWDVAGGRLIRSFGQPDQVMAAAFSPDGLQVVTGDWWARTATVWSVKDGSPLRSFPHPLGVNAVAFSPDSLTIATGGMDGVARIFDVRTGAVVRPLEGYATNWAESIGAVSFNADGRYLLVGRGNSTAQLSEVATGAAIRSFKGHGGMVVAVAFGPGGKQMATGSWDNTARLWDVATGAEVRSFIGHSDRVQSVAFSPDGKKLLTGSKDGTAKLWEVATGQLLGSLLPLDAQGWASVGADGFYMSSKGTTKGVHFVQGFSSYTFENFDLIYNRPDLVVQRLGQADPALVASYRQSYLKRLKRAGFTEDQISLDMHLPEIVLEGAAPVADTVEKSLSFPVIASDTRYPLERINVYVNDVPVYGLEQLLLRGKSGLSARRTITLRLSEGSNKIQVAALNVKGATSLSRTFIVSSSAPPSKHDLFIVAIGVSRYADEKMNLTYAAKDAGDLATFLAGAKDQFKAVRVLRLLDQDATREKILKAHDFLAQSEVDDHVVLFVAGHGVLDDKLDWYFGSHDIDFAQPAARGVEYGQLEGLLEGIASRRKLLLMDACNSGEVDKHENLTLSALQPQGGVVTARGFKLARESSRSAGTQDAFELMRELFSSVDKGSGAMVVSSAGGAEYAFESAQWHNGVFTYSLLEGLKTGSADTNKDGQIQVSELRDYVMKRVEELTAGRQHPTSRRENLEFDFRVY